MDQGEDARSKFLLSILLRRTAQSICKDYKKLYEHTEGPFFTLSLSHSPYHHSSAHSHFIKSTQADHFAGICFPSHINGTYQLFHAAHSTSKPRLCPGCSFCCHNELLSSLSVLPNHPQPNNVLKLANNMNQLIKNRQCNQKCIYKRF